MTEHKLSSEAIKKLSAIKLISMDSIFENKMLGLIYGNNRILEYYNFENKERRKLAKENSTIWGVHHNLKNKKTQYGGVSNKIFCLEDDLKQKRNNSIQAINSFNGLTIDAGSYGLFNTETNEELISRKSLEDKNISSIKSLNSFNNSLYALVANNDNSCSVVEINTSNPNNFFIGETIKNYELKHTKICNFAIIPQESMRGDNGKDYPFSIITCANISYLDLNGEKILGTEVNNSSDQSIKRLKLIKSTPTTAEVIYSGYNLKAIYKATINLTNKTATTKTIITNISDYVYALQPIFNYDSHKHLSNIGEVIR
ncbi:MAG: hypothetical protein ABIC91_01555 [Nanoarchaeota archaeon]|nr:hypothetical protein [Nanoarchaeota archaeon]